MDSGKESEIGNAAWADMQPGQLSDAQCKPTLRMQLTNRKNLLDKDLAEVNGALKLLDEYPASEEFFKILAKAARHY